jgi:excisionase family DNA binding protein
MTTKLFSIREAAEFLGLDQSTVRRAISAGRLKAVRMGPRLLRVPAAAIDEYLKPVA